MSKTNKIRRLEKDNARLELDNEMLRKDNIALKAKSYSNDLANKATIEELRVALMLLDTPPLLQEQAH